jgi:ABC-type transport system involved in multi-copper enzyme maturation permease subunit
MALLAGNIIACERTDRSAEFLAYQGASRKMVIGSKLILCTITFILICAISFVLSFWLSPLPNMGVNAESWKLL